MKKTINITISGQLFHIEEDAYSRLSQYITNIKQYFEGSDGQEEIIADIESRIAELFQQNLNEFKQVISLQDVQHIIEVLGQPSEMDDEGNGNESTQGKSYSFKRRLFRDTDNRKAAGVAAGLAAYFSIDPIWFRIAFLVLTLASGSGILVYIILWIVIPAARSTTEKLEMKGEPVNIETIEKSIREELAHVRSSLNEFAKEARESMKTASKHTGNYSKKAAHNLLRFFYAVVRILAIVIGFVFLFAGLSLIMAAGSFFLGWDNFSVLHDLGIPVLHTEKIIPYLFANSFAVSLAPMAIGGFIAIPLIMLVYGGLRLILGRLVKLPGLSGIAAGLWVASIVILAYIIFGLMLDLRESYHSISSEIILEETHSPVLTISIDNTPQLEANQYLQFFDSYVQFISNDAHAYLLPMFYVEYTDKDYPFVITKFEARGSSIEKARERTKGIRFEIQNNDSSLLIPGSFSLATDESLRAQQVIATLYLPEGQQVYFDESTHHYFSQHPSFRMRHHTYAGSYWIMTKKGLRPSKEISQSTSS